MQAQFCCILMLLSSRWSAASSPNVVHMTQQSTEQNGTAFSSSVDHSPSSDSGVCMGGAVPLDKGSGGKWFLPVLCSAGRKQTGLSMSSTG